jgi:WD40 repeat protein/serine/threonine protein kinase
MTDSSLAPEDLPAHGGSESRDFWSRIIEYDDALGRGFTIDQSRDPTVPSFLTPDQVRELLDCLDLLHRFRSQTPIGEGERRLVGSKPLVAETKVAPESIHLTIGRFEIFHELGRGGHAVVLLANDPLLHRHVALKVPRPEFLHSERMRRRFVGEAQAAASLDHPNVLKLFEVGLDRTFCYLAVELCRGPTLARWLGEQTAPVDPKLAAQIVLALANGIDHAHTLGVLHRDLKPANVLLKPNAEGAASDILHSVVVSGMQPIEFIPKICDFGIAKVLHAKDDSTEKTVTGTGTAMGTFPYMSPEQAAGRPAAIGPQTDIYGLGAILYEVLTRQPPIQGETDLDVLRKILIDEPVRVRRIRHDIPEDIEAICHKCLEKQPRNRYESAAALAKDLAQFLQGEPVQARRLTPMVRLGRSLRRRQFSSRSVVTGVGLGMILILASAAIVWRTQQNAVRESLENTRKEQSAERLQTYPDEIRRADLILRMAETGGMDRQLLSQEVRQILSKYIPKGGGEELRGFEWHYLWQILHPQNISPAFTELHAIEAHEKAAYFVVFSPDGKRLATSGADFKGRVWDAETAQLRCTLSGHSADVNWVDFSATGELLATASDDRTVRVWDGASGVQRELLWTHQSRVVGVAFNPASHHLAATTGDGIVRVWQLSPRRDIARFDAHQGREIEALAYSPDGKILATIGDDDRLRLWDAVDSYRRLTEYEAHSETVTFSHDGRKVAVGGDSDTRIYAVPTGQLLSRFFVKEDHLRSLRFTSNDSALVMMADESARLLDLTTGESWSPFGALLKSWCVAFSPDGRGAATTGADGKLRIWDSSPRRASRRVDVEFRAKVKLHAAISPDGTRLAIATSAQDQQNPPLYGDTTIWNIAMASPKRLRAVDPADGKREIFALAFSPDGDSLAIGDSGKNGSHRVRLINAESGREQRRLTSGAQPQWLGFAPRGNKLLVQLATGHTKPSEWRLQFLDSSSGLPTGELHQFEGVCAVAFSPTEAILATIGANPLQRIELYRLSDRTRIAELEPSPESVRSLEFTADGRHLIADSNNGRISVYSRETGHIERRFKVPGISRMPGSGARLSPDGRTLAIPSTDGIVLAHYKSGQPLCSLPLPRPVAALYDLAFSRDGRAILAVGLEVSGTSGVYLWQIDPSDEPAAFQSKPRDR